MIMTIEAENIFDKNSAPFHKRIAQQTRKKSPQHKKDHI